MDYITHLDGQNVLITLITNIYAPDGNTYFGVWGELDVVATTDTTNRITVGQGEGSVVVRPENVLSILQATTAPAISENIYYADNPAITDSPTVVAIRIVNSLDGYTFPTISYDSKAAELTVGKVATQIAEQFLIIPNPDESDLSYLYSYAQNSTVTTHYTKFAGLSGYPDSDIPYLILYKIAEFVVVNFPNDQQTDILTLAKALISQYNNTL